MFPWYLVVSAALGNPASRSFQFSPAHLQLVLSRPVLKWNHRRCFRPFSRSCDNSFLRFGGSAVTIIRPEAPFVIYRLRSFSPTRPVGSFSTANQLTEKQKNALVISDTLIAELLEIDEIVIGTPMYNFAVPALPVKSALCGDGRACRRNLHSHPFTTYGKK